MREGLDTPIRYIKGIGPKRAAALEGAGIKSVEDALYFFPKRYQDRRVLSHVAGLVPGETAAVEVTVEACRLRESFRRRGLRVLEVRAADATGRLFAVWFNQPYLRSYFKAGTRLFLFGRAELYKDRLQLTSPDFDVLDGEDAAPASRPGILPVYALPQGISQRLMRRVMEQLVQTCLPRLKETLPYDVRSRRGLLNVAQGLRFIHFPATPEDQKRAYERLAFEEFFLFQLPVLLRRHSRLQRRGITFRIDERALAGVRQALPFTLTNAQERVFAEIAADMAAPGPMQRLLQGDVGSGKTIVATLAAVVAAANGYQTAFLVPTEVLAQQHYEKLAALFTQGRGRPRVRVGLLTSRRTPKEKKKALQEVRGGGADIVIGTHALIQQGVVFRRLGLVVIDEQHKFGVAQRGTLRQKGVDPDAIIMTATPIPRTLSLTLCGDLDVSVIDEMPPGRGRVTTLTFPPQARQAVYDRVKRQVTDGGQAYFVYPVIEEDVRLALQSAKRMFRELSEGPFRGLRLGLVHGRLAKDTQLDVMRRFRRGQIDILVATTVLEVGIDVPNASVMVIDSAERFGLSQLHQMRGRVGRGPQASYCYLIADPASEEAQRRLQAMAAYPDGFRIAEEDLKIRGPGEFFGERQHGLTELRLADPLKQMHLLKAAREDAVRLLRDDPSLEARANQELARVLHRRFPEFEKFMEVG